MRFELFLAFRYLRQPKRRLLTRFTALAAIVGIASGVSALVFALALANGFRREMQEKILRESAHVIIYRADESEIRDWREISRKIDAVKNVKSVSAESFDNCLLIGKTSAFAVLRGSQTIEKKDKFISKMNRFISDMNKFIFEMNRFTPKTNKFIPEVNRFTSKIGLFISDTNKFVPNTNKFILNTNLSIFQLNKSIFEVNNPLVKVEIGKILAERTGLQTGDRAEIVVSGNRSSGSLLPTSTTVEISGIFETGLYEYDSTWIRLSLADAARAAGKTSLSVSAVGVETADIYSANLTAAEIQTVLGAEYKVLDWQQTNRPLFAALALERRMALIIIALIVLLAALNITTTLALLVNEHRADIAVLKSCGARSQNILLTYLLAGLILGAIGVAAGVVLSLAACAVCSHFELISLSAEVYSISKIKLEPQIWEILAIISGALVLSLAATIVPARSAAKIRPLDILKN